jgi:hypothetical protein
MSIDQTDVVDFIVENPGTDEISLAISDHLPWMALSVGRTELVTPGVRSARGDLCGVAPAALTVEIPDFLVCDDQQRVSVASVCGI